ncbi:hypothetical protein [Lentzea sp. NPDC004782]|uniref:hypothetical protein n=1 Tax=Lentzea sp. NPDC004782 TaxID=3154458 RepID=UPI0033B9887B
MSTTTNLTLIAAQPRLSDILTGWRLLDPGMQAADAAVADWFAFGVKLLSLITVDPSHPEHTEACALAAEFSHAAIVMRGGENGEGTR